MKQYVYIAAVVIIAGAITFAFLGKGSARPLGVNEVSSDPAAFSGTITVTGIMAGISQHDPTVFGVMDKKELQCTTPGCKKVYLPIRYQGKMPVLGDEVRATGSFTNDSSGYLFLATKVKVLRNHRIGG